MNINDVNGNRSTRLVTAELVAEDSVESPHTQPPFPPEPEMIDGRTDGKEAKGFATRADLNNKPGMERSKVILLGGGLLIAVLFFVFTAIAGKSHSPRTASEKQSPQQQKTDEHKGSVTPLMETVRKPAPDNAGGQLGPADIKRTRSSDGGAISQANSGLAEKPMGAKPATSGSLGSVPSFSDTQQKWDEPQPYGAAPPASAAQTQQLQNTLKEPSLIFVRSQAQNQVAAAAKENVGSDDGPVLEVTPGTRIQAKLETQISNAVQAPVVAVVEYTYAIGDKVVVPAGARVYGQLQQADRNGYVSVKFDEIELLNGAREKIEAIGTGLDLGPIKGAVYGKNTGRNFLVRTVSGISSVAAMLVGNNRSSTFSEGDLIRERVAQNIGNAGDSEVMSLTANSRVVVSVPADTKIYIVFTKREPSSSTLHKVAPANP
jgi:Bacterial conjugation TrbI-like protein